MGLGVNKARLLGISAARRTERSVLPSLQIPSDLYYYVTVFSQIAPCILTSSIRSVLTEIVSLDDLPSTQYYVVERRRIIARFCLSFLRTVLIRNYKILFDEKKYLISRYLFIHLFIYLKTAPIFQLSFLSSLIFSLPRKKRKEKIKNIHPTFSRFAHSDALIAHYVP